MILRLQDFILSQCGTHIYLKFEVITYSQKNMVHEGVHRRSQGVQWVHLHPQGGEKIFSGLIYRKKCVSAPPSQSKSQFLGQFLRGGLDLEVYFDGL